MPRTSEGTQNFKNYATAWQGATIAVVCAGTAAILRGAHQPRGKDAAGVVLDLQNAVAETGKKTAMLYRYVALAKAFASRIEKQEGGDNSPLGNVLTAKSAEAATNWLVDFLDGEGVRSVDAISQVLGVYKRTPKKAAGRRAPARAAAERVSTAAIREVVAKAPEAKVIQAYVKTHTDVIALAEELAKQIEDRDTMAEVLEIFQDRMEEMIQASSRTTRRRSERATNVLQ